MCNSPLGAPCDNIARVSKPPLVKHSSDGGSVSTGDIIEQTTPPAAAAIESVRFPAHCSNTSDLVSNADLSPLVPLITETIVPPTHTAPLVLTQVALSTTNARGVIEGAGVDLGGGRGLTDGLSNSPSFVSASCVLGRDALSPASAAQQACVIGRAGSALSHSIATHVFPPIPVSSASVPATCMFMGDGAAFANALLGVHVVVTSYNQPNFRGPRIPVPTILNLPEWEKICVTPEDHLTFQYLQFGFPTGYERPVSTPTFHNHPSAAHHSTDVEAYILKELGEGAMMGPFDQPPFTPWTQTNPLFTRPKRDSHLRRIIMDLSWPSPLGVTVNGGTRRKSFLGIPPKMHLPSAK